MRKRSAANQVPEADPLDEGGESSTNEIPPPAEKPSVRDVAKSPKRYDFKSAHARTDKDAELRPDLVDIVETVWVENMSESWKRIKASLHVGPRRSEIGILMKKLDEARKLSYEAHCLYVTAQREYDRWELENEVVFSAFWNQASRELEAERADKTRSKNITDQDIRSKVMTMAPDEFIAQETKRKAVKLTVANMTQLSKEANEHVEDIRVMLAKLKAL